MIYVRRGDLALRRGDFHSAHGALESALGIATRWEFGVPLLFAKQRMAELLWMSGQPGDALALHLDPKLREFARRAAKEVWLLRSHLNAAKCAIDAKKTGIAEAELACAQAILETEPPGVADLPGYYLLYSGEVELQRAEVDSAIEKYNRALAFFEAMDPVFRPGVLAAKIALAEFALYEGNYRLFLDLLRMLLTEAEDSGCVEARSRLLLLEAYPSSPRIPRFVPPSTAPSSGCISSTILRCSSRR